jgi:ATP-binding cassette subfamily F protein 3
MSVLTASGLRKFYADRLVLSGVTLSIEQEEKVALIGRNGSGKTTLLRLLAGLDEPDGGSVARARWVRVGYLAQIPTGSDDVDVFSHALSGAANVRALEARLRELEAQMAASDGRGNAAQLAEVMDEYAQARHHFEHAGGFTLEARARAVLGGLGFAGVEMTKALGTLSGGWRVRAELARVLLAEPDLLLLDEPTNHLDLAATEWLEEYLTSFPGAALLVSHDRRLLDAVTSRTLELEGGQVTSFPGPYSKYAVLRAAQIEREAEVYRRRQEEVEKLEAYIRRYRAGNRARQAKSREKRLTRLSASPVEPPRAQPVMRTTARAASTSGRMVVRLQGVAKRYGETDVFSATDLELYRGDRVGLLGANGTGKTTLLKLMAGLESPSSGRVLLGSVVRARYFAQESTSTMPDDRAVLDEILDGRSMTPEQARTYLGRFLFRGEEVFKHVGMLSGGERQRLSLAKLLLEQPNLLLLDEPTNHLDIPSREALESALLEFPGTFVIATHDRYLLERLATRMLIIDSKQVSDFHGTYADLRARRAPSAPRASRQPTRARAATQKRSSGRRVKLQAPTFGELATLIAAAEEELTNLGTQLADPELYRDGERAKATRVRYEQAGRRLEDLYRQLAALQC